MYNKKNIEQNNKEEVNYIKNKKNNKYNINMGILSSIKSMPSKSISLDDNNSLLKIKDTNRKNQMQSSSETELNISPNFTCSSSMSKDSFLNNNRSYYNYLTPPPPSIFKPMIHSSNIFNCFNYLPNLSPPFQVCLNPHNSFLPNYCIYCGNKFNYNLPPIFNNNEQLIQEDNHSLDKNIFLNKKREADDNSLINIEINNEQNGVFDISTKKKRILNKNIINEKIQENPKQIENYFCKHNGCNTSFQTKKLAIFHHFKKSPECYDDNVCLLKLINETKKIVLKNNKEKNLDINKISSLYENAMKDLSLVECIKMYTGFKFKDDL